MMIDDETGDGGGSNSNNNNNNNSSSSSSSSSSSNNNNNDNSNSSSNNNDNNTIDNLSSPAIHEYDIKIQNIVCTIDFGMQLDLISIASKISRAEHNPSRFPAVIVRLLHPRSTALIFKSGKVVITGTKNKRDSFLGCQKLARILQQIGYAGIRADQETIRVRNMTATCNIGIPVTLEGFLYAHVNNATYEPELFPGLIYKMTDPVKVVLLIFVSGKIVVTGAKGEDDICQAMQVIGPLLYEFRKKHIAIRNS